MSLFKRSLPLGKIDVIFPYAVANLREEKNGNVELTFRPLNKQVIFHFSEYSNNLAEYYDRLESFKKKLAIQEPQELVELITEPLLGDVSSIEASEIAIGWLPTQIRNVPRPAMRIERSELDELGKSWKVDIWLLGRDLGGGDRAAFPFSLYIDIFTGKVIKAVSTEEKDLSVEELEKAIINLYSAQDKTGLYPLVSTEDVFKE
jgi:hypothetical protein